ncbi:MAG: beta-ketoacyl-ACP synthase II [Chloroflexota bacterium]
MSGTKQNGNNGTQARMMERKRVVVTGLGAVSPVGNDVETTWANLLAGTNGIETITSFDTSTMPIKVGGTVKDFDPKEYMHRKDARRLGPFIQYAIATAQQAVDQAGLDMASEDPTRVGLEISSALGGMDIIEAQANILDHKGYKGLNPTLIPACLINMGACFVGIQLGIQGPTHASVSACATGLTSIGEAMRRIIWGEVDVMLAGATESTMSPLAFGGFARLGALTNREDPNRAITPFDASRDGTVIGEGGGTLVLESLEHAQARQAPILAELVGYALTGDAHHITAPSPEGSGASRAMTNALQDADLSAEDIDYIVAHGTGTPLNDAGETKAVKRTFGEVAYDIPMTSIKSMTGHMLGAAGALSAVTVVQAMNDGKVPPTIGILEPDPNCDLDYVPNEARQVTVNCGMANAFGFGGQNASVIFKKWAE